MSHRPGGRSAGLAAVSPDASREIDGTVGQVSATPECTPCVARLVAVGPFTRSGSLPPDAVALETAATRLLPPAAAVAHLPRATLTDVEVALAIRGGPVAQPAAPGHPAVAAFDAAGDLLGILRPHPSGAWRLRPNFQGVG